MDNKIISEKLHWRYATKVFDKTKKISDSDWKTLEQSLVLSPSSYGLQPWKFIVVENKEMREKLKTVSWNQSQVVDASHFVVFTTLKRVTEDYVKEFIASNASIRGVPVESLAGFQNMMVKNITNGMQPENLKSWTQRQSYIAMGFLLETAALLNIDTVALEGLQPSAYDEILGLNQTDYGTVAAVALGYRDASDKYQFAKKVRFDASRVVQYIR